MLFHPCKKNAVSFVKPKVYCVICKLNKRKIKMDNKQRKLSRGIQDFEQIRRDGYVYVDKTDLVWQMAHGDVYNYLSRPRRFGKSLLASTLQCYFEGKKELFNGLKIMELERDWTCHPVLHFDLSQGGSTNAKLISYLSSALSAWEQLYGCVSSESVFQSLGVRFRQVIEKAYQETGQGVVVLIDEYDAPLQHTLFVSDEHEQCKITYRDFFAVLKAAGAHLRFVFLTGITKFTQLSLFSVLNNLSNLSFQSRYDAICGITEEELVTTFRPELEALGKANRWSMDVTLGHIKEMYDGYHFTEDLHDIYNPYSVICALSEMRLIGYWASSGGSSLLVDLVQHLETEVPDLENVLISQDELLTSDISLDNVPLFLYQIGYLTIKGYADEIYTLGIPNKEVRNALYQIILPKQLALSKFSVSNATLRLKTAILAGDIQEGMRQLEQLVAETPYSQDKKEMRIMEERFQFILKQIFYICGFQVEEEHHVAGGRIDLVVRSAKNILVLELKMDTNGGAEAAQEQIRERGYADAYKGEKLPVFAIGIVFNAKKRGISDWSIKTL